MKTWRVTQNGLTLLDRTETVDGMQLTLTVCPADFDVTPAGGGAGFLVYFLADRFCGCE